MTTPPSASDAREVIRRLPPAHIVGLAIKVSTYSPCRSKRGCVVFRGDDVIANGYNYKPRGFDCDGSDECKAVCRHFAVHAEQQALLFAGKSAYGAEMLHVKTVAGALVASGGPSCAQCSKLALVAGVSAMWLYHEDGWRRYDAAEWHRLSVEHTEAGLREARALLVQQERDGEAVSHVVAANEVLQRTVNDQAQRLVEAESQLSALQSRLEALEKAAVSWMDGEPGIPCGCGHDLDAHGVAVTFYDRCTHHTEMQSRLEAAEARAMRWQPIETAPKDGTRFIGGYRHKTYGWVSDLARYYDEDKHGPRQPYVVMVGGGEPTHWSAIPPEPGTDLRTAERSSTDAALARLEQLPRYTERDVERRPSMAEYLNAEDVDEILTELRALRQSGGSPPEDERCAICHAEAPQHAIQHGATRHRFCRACWMAGVARRLFETLQGAGGSQETPHE